MEASKRTLNPDRTGVLKIGPSWILEVVAYHHLWDCTHSLSTRLQFGSTLFNPGLLLVFRWEPWPGVLILSFC